LAARTCIETPCGDPCPIRHPTPAPADRQRWIMYKDKSNYNPTQIPPEWHGWLNYINDYPPTTVGAAGARSGPHPACCCPATATLHSPPPGAPLGVPCTLNTRTPPPADPWTDGRPAKPDATQRPCTLACSTTSGGPSMRSMPPSARPAPRTVGGHPGAAAAGVALPVVRQAARRRPHLGAGPCIAVASFSGRLPPPPEPPRSCAVRAAAHPPPPARRVLPAQGGLDQRQAPQLVEV
jgi:hypothetical protein